MKRLWFLLLSFLFTFLKFANGNELNQTSKTHTCPNGWVIGDNCGKEWCYKIIPVPYTWQVYCVENNLCKLYHPKALPASIHCAEENNFFTKFPYSGPYPKAQYAIGLFIPQKVGWNRNHFRYFDGTKLDYTNWAGGTGPNREPNSMPLYKSQVEKIVVYVVESKNQTGWADFNPVRIRHLICKMAAEPLPQAAPTIPCPTVITVLPTKISKKSCHV